MSLRYIGTAVGALTLSLVVSVPTAAQNRVSGAIVYAAVADGVSEYDAMTGRRLAFIRKAQATTVAVDAAQNLYVGRLTQPLAPAAFIGVYAPRGDRPVTRDPALGVSGRVSRCRIGRNRRRDRRLRFVLPRRSRIGLRRALQSPIAT